MVILHNMRRPIYVRPLSDAERETLEAGLRSSDAFVMRRCQILLASGRGEDAYQIARSLGCNPQTAGNAIHKFNEKGLDGALQQGSKRPHRVRRAFEEKRAQTLREMLHQDPRKFGKDTSLWTLEMAAEVSFEEGLTKERVSGETVRATLERLGVRWERAKRWITSPVLRSTKGKKKTRPADERVAANNPDTWTVGFCDETWWSRFWRPALNSFSEAGKPLRLVEQSIPRDDPDTKAISCYGLLCRSLKRCGCVLWMAVRLAA